jgi:hypothetical protein
MHRQEVTPARCFYPLTKFSKQSNRQVLLSARFNSDIQRTTLLGFKTTLFSQELGAY